MYQAPDHKAQDEMFVEWSHSVSATEHDVAATLGYLRKQGPGPLTVLDVGGGIGTLARVLAEQLPNVDVTVVDPSPLARERFSPHHGTRFMFGDFGMLEFPDRYDVIIFRTVLHHILGNSERSTASAQVHALRKAGSLLRSGGRVFVTENFYEPMLGEDLTGELIYRITSSRAVAGITRALGANTAGEGVRFRSYRAWQRIIAAAGLRLLGNSRNPDWGQSMPLWQRLPLLCSGRFQGLLEIAADT